MQSKPNVLLVEGDSAEELLARMAITSSEVDCDVRVARDGAEACLMLSDREHPSPTLILLELAIPNGSGFDVLKRIRNCEATRRVPVIIFSSSEKQSDIDKCFDLHANSYVLKVKDHEINSTRLKLALYYWIAVNQNV